MAGEPGYDLPYSRSELYHIAERFYLRNFETDPEQIWQFLVASGRQVARGLFNSAQALAAYNVGRQPTEKHYPYEVPLDDQAYRVSFSPGQSKYRVTAVADVIDRPAGVKKRVAITLNSSKSLSPFGWLDEAELAFSEFEAKYQYEVDDIQIFDPRMRE